MEGIGAPASMQTVVRLLWPQRPRVVRYAVAVALVLAVAAVKRIVPALGSAEPEVLLTIPVALAGLYGGLGPGLMAAIAATLVGTSLDPLFSGRAVSMDPLGTMVVLALRTLVAASAAAVRIALVRTASSLRELEELQREREAFVEVLAHELRNPLSALGGYLELAERYAGDLGRRDRLPEVLRTARAESARLARHINDLELLLSVSTPRLDATSRPVDLRASALRAVERARTIAGARELRLELADVPIVVSADPDRVDQIVDNFIKNALRYAPRDRPIVVRARARTGGGGMLGVLSVCDQGPGVAPDERERIFERFTRGAAAAGTAGSGVGLAVARELARLMGGRVFLEETSAKGSTFSLELPLRVIPGSF